MFSDGTVHGCIKLLGFSLSSIGWRRGPGKGGAFLLVSPLLAKGSVPRFLTICRLPLSLARSAHGSQVAPGIAEQLAMGTWANVARRLYEATPYKAWATPLW